MNSFPTSARSIVSALLLCSSAYAGSIDTRRNPTNAASEACPSSIVLANLVATSDLIVVANPDVPIPQMQSAMQTSSPPYVDVPLVGPSFLKGAQTGQGLTVKVYPKVTSYAPSPEALVEQTGKPSLLFLTRADRGPNGIYLTHFSSVQEATALRIEAVKAEVRRQQQLVTAASSQDQSLPHFEEVRGLLSRLSKSTPDQQAKVFRQLEALGRQAVPGIIAQMDDRRPLADPSISLGNPAGAFEGRRHYGPELVVDALDAILNQITGFGGSIVSGGSARERQAAVSAWRVYAADMKCRLGRDEGSQ